MYGNSGEWRKFFILTRSQLRPEGEAGAGELIRALKWQASFCHILHLALSQMGAPSSRRGWEAEWWVLRRERDAAGRAASQSVTATSEESPQKLTQGRASAKPLANCGMAQGLPWSRLCREAGMETTVRREKSGTRAGTESRTPTVAASPPRSPGGAQ